MASNLPIEPRWIVGVLAMVLVAALMYVGTIPAEAGLVVIVGVLAALGLYERKARKAIEARLEGNDGN